MFKEFQMFLTKTINYFELILKTDRKNGFNFFITRQEMIAILSHVEDGLVSIRNHIVNKEIVFKNDLYGEVVEVNA